MARPRKKAEDLVPDKAPLEEPVETGQAVPTSADAEPVAEAEAERAAEAEAEPAAVTAPRKPPGSRPARGAKKKTKRGALRPGERAAIVRLPKPEHERGQRKERRGVVVSSAMDKTIVVRVETAKPDPRYKKVVRRSTKFHAHDERNEANVGDVVRVVETRPLSKTKNWRLAEVIEAAR